MISVVIATRNGGRFLARAIASIAAQSERPAEVIIVSDASTDDTVSVAYTLTAAYPYIVVIDLERNVGPGLARDHGIRRANGPYVAILDDDDEWLAPNKLAIQRTFLDENGDYALVGASRIELVREDGAFDSVFVPLKEDQEIRDRCLLGNEFVTSSIMFRKLDYLKVGGYSDMRQAEDYDLGLKLLRIGKGANLDGCDTRYYMRQSGAHRSNRQGMSRSILSVVRRHMNEFPHCYQALAKAYARVLYTKFM